MKTRYRWLRTAIEFAATDNVDMHWLARENRRDWRRRCSARANSGA